MKKLLLHGLVAGLLSASAAMLYNYFYKTAQMVDFSKVISIPGILGFNLAGCLLASVGYYYFSRAVQRNTDAWFNMIFIVISFASFIPVFLFNLPLDISSPEMFAGLAIPMHLFPIVFWLGSKPAFWK